MLRDRVQKAEGVGMGNDPTGKAAKHETGAELRERKRSRGKSGRSGSQASSRRGNQVAKELRRSVRHSGEREAKGGAEEKGVEGGDVDADDDHVTVDVEPSNDDFSVPTTVSMLDEYVLSHFVTCSP